MPESYRIPSGSTAVSLQQTCAASPPHHNHAKNAGQPLFAKAPAWVLSDQLGEPERLPWSQAMNGVVWERLTRIHPRQAMGLPHGWGPQAIRAAYVRCFGRPPHWDRRRYVYSVPELLAVADLLEAEAATWGAGR